VGSTQLVDIAQPLLQRGEHVSDENLSR
jgi:hypothetical protein